MLFIFLSCDNLFFIERGNVDVSYKTTYKAFDHLNEPIVILMEVYEQKNFIGIEKLGSKLVCKGNIFVIIDIETNTVFDWVFVATDKIFYQHRAVEAGETSKKYYTSVWYGRKLAYIEADETKPVVLTDTSHPGFLTISPTKKNRIIIDGVGRDYDTWEELYIANVFDTTTNTFVGNGKAIKTDSIGYIQPAQADPDGNYWLATQTHTSEEDYIASVWKIDCEQNELIGPVKQYECYTFKTDSEGNETQESDTVDVLYVNESYVFAVRSPLGSYKHDTEIYLIDKNNPEKEEKNIIIPYRNNVYISKIFEIDGTLYCLLVNFYDNKKLFIYPIDTENLCLGEKECEFNFDFTENVYVRGNRLYLFQTRRVNDVNYT